MCSVSCSNGRFLGIILVALVRNAGQMLLEATWGALKSWFLALRVGRAPHRKSSATLTGQKAPFNDSH